MVLFSPARLLAALAIFSALAISSSCRRSRFPPRGDAAAVVVVAPRRDAAPAPTLAEQEPNDEPAQAQALDLTAALPRLVLEGALALSAEGKLKDVDVFKLLVSGGTAPPAAAVDSGRFDDPRIHARRLSIEVAVEGATGLLVQILDDASQAMEGIGVEPGQSAGMPNLAVTSGQTYYVRIRARAKPTAPRGTQAEAFASKYRLAVYLGDFEVADEREPNGTRESANPIAVVGSAEWSGYHGWPRDQDFFRIARPEVLSAMDVDLDPVDGVGASVQVVDDTGTRLGSSKGRRGERVALRNVVLRPAIPDAGPASRYVYLVVRGETGSQRAQRYVLRVAMGGPQANVEVEPNDAPAAAMPVTDGTITGYLPVGDTDCFRYEGNGPRDLTVEVTFPARVRGKVAAFRLGTGEPAGSAETKKPRQTVTLPLVATLGQSIVLRISQPKGDGNATEPYSMRLVSVGSKPPSSAVPVPTPAP